MTHRAPEDGTTLAEAETPPRPSLVSRVFREKHLPHFGIVAITALYVAFWLATGGLDNGGAGVPQPISLGFTGTLAAWFGYLVQQSRKEKGGTP